MLTSATCGELVRKPRRERCCVARAGHPGGGRPVQRGHQHLRRRDRHRRRHSVPRARTRAGSEMVPLSRPSRSSKAGCSISSGRPIASELAGLAVLQAAVERHGARVVLGEVASGHRLEAQLRGVEAAEPPGELLEVVQRRVGVQREGVADGGDQRRHPPRVEQHAGGRRVPEHLAEELLLALDPGRVAALEPVALPDERERLVAVEVVVADDAAEVAEGVVQVGAPDPLGPGVVEGRLDQRRGLDADVDTTDRIGDPLESREVDRRRSGRPGCR